MACEGPHIHIYTYACMCVCVCVLCTFAFLQVTQSCKVRPIHGSDHDRLPNLEDTVDSDSLEGVMPVMSEKLVYWEKGHSQK